jgi:uncharacterized protein (TIGR02996 family)
MAALEPTERELLEAVARDPTDEAALAVLADYWIEHGEQARGEYLHLHLQLGERGARIDRAAVAARFSDEAWRWRVPLLRAGYDPRELALDRGFLQRPLAVPAGDQLDGDPDLLRLSPRYYRELRTLRAGRYLTMIAAEAVTPLGAERVVLKAPCHPEARPSLEREHAILSRLRHPNVARELGLAIRPGWPALVLAWSGASLDRLLASARELRRTLGVAFAVSVACQLCDALAAIHAAGIIHLEVRADHVLVAADGTVTLIAFGDVHVAKPMWPDAKFRRGPRKFSSDWVADLVIDHFSPEQARAMPLDECTDLYSVAVLACELVEGLHPVYGRTWMERLTAAQTGNLLVPALPSPVATVIRRALARRSARIGSARELGDALAIAAAAASIEIGPHVIAQSLCELGVPA